MRLLAEKLCGERGGENVFSDISFSLAQGDAMVVTGANGAGKSTLLRIAAGLLPAASGTIRLTGASEAWPGVPAASHYLGHHNAMKPALTVAENLSFWRDFSAEPRDEIAAALALVGLHGIDAIPFGYLSTGQKRRVSIARLLVTYRPIWLLDEPTAGLDGNAERQVSALIEGHRSTGGIVIAATHHPLRLEASKSLELGRTGAMPALSDEASSDDAPHAGWR